MINPGIRDKIINKGLSVILNSIVGYDSEYDLNSSSLKINDLLSIQLAGSTNIIVKVPIITSYNKGDFELEVTPSKNIIESKLRLLFHNSIKDSVDNLRIISHSENDVLLGIINEKISDIKDVTKIQIEGYNIYAFVKSDVKRYIKYTSSYSSKQLVSDSDILLNKDIEDSFINFMGVLNGIRGCDMSSKLKKSVLRSSNKPQSRISYRHGSSKLNISIKRIMYICMHESTADLSILSDFDTFKEQLDIINRSFVTLKKPLDIEGCKSKMHFRDTVLIAPQGVKSLAEIGNIYGDEAYKKVDIGDYRKGRMRELLDINKELFDKYALRDAEITLKHASEMENFNLTVNKLGVPLTLSGIGKSYVLKE
jgi:hypothetical protein